MVKAVKETEQDTRTLLLCLIHIALIPLDEYKVMNMGLDWLRVKDIKTGKFYRIEVKELI